MTILRILLLLVLATPSLLLAADEQEIVVVSGDSLYNIVRFHYPDLSGSWTGVAREIVEMNPHAFSNGDPATLRVGATLALPDYSTPVVAAAPTPVPEQAAASDADEEPAPQPARHPLAVIGEVIAISGQPLAIDINNEQRNLAMGGKIYRGDALLTDGGAAARFRMNDDAELLLRPNSRLVVNDYSYFAGDAAGSRSLITLLKGGLRYITGMLGQRNPQGFNVRTPVATIGIRGTDFGTMICDVDECLLPDSSVLSSGTYSGVLAGEIALGNDAGEFPVIQGEIVRTASTNSVPELAPEAAALLFTDSERALLTPEQEKPLNLFQWLRRWVTGSL